MHINNGLLSIASYQPSPNCNDRPTQIDTIVIHGISLPPGEFGQGFIEDLFCNRLDTSKHPYFETLKGLKVSSHLLINRQGWVTQFVPFNQRAWHAGESEFLARKECNDFSIGIELEGTDDLSYADAQYELLKKITVCLMKEYPAISKDRIVGHSDIAPGRKTDPGVAFDWSRFREMV